jgi:hypothetical protein
MKKIFFLLLLLTAVLSCKSKKTVVSETPKMTTKILKECLAGANCMQETHRDAKLTIKIEDSGKPFFALEPQIGTTVYRYEMSENQDQQYMDGGYREEIIFELPSDFKIGVISGEALLETKALFGVFCYCKGKAGYYFIEQGTITGTKEGITIEFPQIVEGQKVFKVQF